MYTVVILCNKNIIKYSIITLKNFIFFNKNFQPYIISKNIDSKDINICKEYNINLLDIQKYTSNKVIINNLSLLGAYYVYNIINTNYLIVLRPFIYCNHKILMNINSIKYLGTCQYNNDLGNFFETINKVFIKINKNYKQNKLNNYANGAIKIYNVKNLKKINFFSIIQNYYNTIKNLNMEINDDILINLYKVSNPEKLILFRKFFCISKYTSKYINYINKIFFFEFDKYVPNYLHVKNE